jgi:hypothetical protein
MRARARWLCGVAAALATAGAAAADDAAEALARKHAPVVRLVDQPEECGPGEPFQPTDVALLFGSDEVALRGPWDRTNLVEIGPSAERLGAGLHGYHLDFPGDPLSPGCDYERWARRLTLGSPPTAYAHVVAEPERPGRLALQYWFFYPYNDFNNKHEGDWEMIQLVFDAADAREALAREPERIGYSQHEGAEQAAWGDPKLERAGARPVVYAAAGSHANYFEPGLFLGRSAAQGVGCDDTGGPWREAELRVVLVPAAPDAARAQPWLGFEGRWGEQRPAFFNGPTGPNDKPQWTRPITWGEQHWRERSYAVVGGASLGPRATDFFCTGIESGSDLLRQLGQRPGAVLLGLALLALALYLIASRTQWQPGAPLRLARRRAWGQILVASGRIYAAHPRLFLGVGLLFVPVSLAASLAQSAALRLAALAAPVASEGEANTLAAGLGVFLGLGLGLAALAVVQAVCARALAEIDAGTRPAALACYRRVLPRWGSLLGALLWLASLAALLSLTGIGVPLALWCIGRAALLAQAVELEGLAARPALRRSFALVRGRWWRVAFLLGVVTGAPLLAGPLAGMLLLLGSGAPFALVNLVSSAVYAVSIPFAAIATSYLYFDLAVRERLAPAGRTRGEVLPAEVEA